MGGDVPAAVTYWTGIWDPRREALSKEVHALRTALSPGSPVVSFSKGQRTALSPRDGVVRLSSNRWLLLRALAAAIEPLGRVTHVVGELGPWHLLRAVGRRPILCTVAIESPALDARMYDKVSLFIAETDTLAAALTRAGIAPERVRVVYPGVDLRRFQPSPLPPARPFRMLFASTPADPAEIPTRGIPLLVEAARRCPDVHVTLLWRQWGDLQAGMRALASLHLPPNVEVAHRDVHDMSSVYQAAHATVCLYARGFGKSCPQSVIESLACGRPALVADGSGLATVIDQSGAGVVVEASVEGVMRGMRQLGDSISRYGEAARAAALTHFNVDVFCARYRDLYDELSQRSKVKSQMVSAS
jgi:glycosyltransferase involved in cell wall biosynthesis